MSFDLNAVISQAAAESVNLSEASKGGGATPPNAGTCIATVVGYVELGRRVKKGYKGAPDKKVRKGRFILELAGGTNPHTMSEGDNPVKIAKRINVNVWLPEPGKQPSAKSGLYLFMSAVNYEKDPAIKIPAQLIGKHVKVIVSVEEFTNEAGEVIKYGSIGGAQDGFKISAPRIDLTDEAGMPTGEFKVIPAPERVSDLRCFLWDYPSMEMWDSLFIDGEYEAKPAENGKAAVPAKSKNVIQEEVMQALDWEGSPMQTLLASKGIDLNVDDIASADAPAGSSSAAVDPLEGML